MAFTFLCWLASAAGKPSEITLTRRKGEVYSKCSVAGACVDDRRRHASKGWQAGGRAGWARLVGPRSYVIIPVASCGIRELLLCSTLQLAVQLE